MDAVAHALADPIRRDILQMLRDGSRTAGAIAGAFDVSRPAVSRHLRVLREAALVRDELKGRERFYALDLSALAELEEFLAALHRTKASEWERRLLALETEVHRTRRQRRAAQEASGETGRPAKTTKGKTA